MKKNLALILASMLSTALVAQVPPPAPADNNPPQLPAPGASAPAPDNSIPAATSVTPPEASTGSTNATAAKKKTKKKTVKKKDSKKETKAAKATSSEIAPAEPLVVGEPAVARQDHVNIRGQAHINSEVVGHLQKGDTVTVLEEVTLKHPKTDEPTKWAKITLPASTHVWVNSSFIDATNQTVSTRKLNMRTGPGENYSVIGTLLKGDSIKLAGNTKGDWTQIDAPTNAFAFVAAHLLTHKAPEAPAAIASNPTPVTPLPQPVVPTPEPTVVPNQQPLAIAQNPPAVPVVNPQVPLPPVAPAPAAPDSNEPPPPRIIEREGVVGNTVSIQAPSHFELKSLDDGRTVDYLYTTSTNLNLGKYKGRTILVTGEEELDERWPNTPVLTIKKIHVVE